MNDIMILTNKRISCFCKKVPLITYSMFVIKNNKFLNLNKKLFNLITNSILYFIISNCFIKVFEIVVSN